MDNSAPPPQATPSPTLPPPDRHTVYTSLVENDNDLVGLVAYSLYKRDKLGFKEKQRAELGREATTDELVAFARGVCLAGPIESYRQRATGILQQMYDDLLSVQTAEVEKEYRRKLVEELKEAHPFWREVLVHFLATVLLVLLGGLIALGFVGQHVGWKQTFSNAFNMPAAEGHGESHPPVLAPGAPASGAPVPRSP